MERQQALAKWNITKGGEETNDDGKAEACYTIAPVGLKGFKTGEWLH